MSASTLAAPEAAVHHLAVGQRPAGSSAPSLHEAYHAAALAAAGANGLALVSTIALAVNTGRSRAGVVDLTTEQLATLLDTSAATVKRTLAALVRHGVLYSRSTPRRGGRLRRELALAVRDGWSLGAPDGFEAVLVEKVTTRLPWPGPREPDRQ